MSSPSTATPVRPVTPIEQPKRGQLSAVQVAASALAAVSSAVVASLFGVAGTLIGAALASVIATVGTALYTESLRKTNQRLQKVLVGRPASSPGAAAEPVVARTLPAHLDPRRAPVKRSGPRWSRIAIYAVGVFVVAIGVVTGVELLAQEPVSALVGSSSVSGTTTLGELTNASSQRDTTPSAPTSPTTPGPAAPSDGASSDSTSSGSTETTAPSASPSAATSSATAGTPEGTASDVSTGTGSAPTAGGQVNP